MHIARHPHNIQTGEQVGRMQKVSPHQAIMTCWSQDPTPGVSAPKSEPCLTYAHIYSLM